LLAILQADIAVELRPGKNVGELDHVGLGNQQNAVIDYVTHGAGGNKKWKQ
jgi:hypothetical protein